MGYAGGPPSLGDRDEEVRRGMMTGSALGLLIGIISGTVFLLLLRTAVSASNKGASSNVMLTAKFFAIPTFWFGPWLTNKLLTDVKLGELADPYVVSLAVTFGLISLYPAARFILQLGEDFG